MRGVIGKEEGELFSAQSAEYSLTISSYELLPRLPSAGWGVVFPPSWGNMEGAYAP